MGDEIFLGNKRICSDSCAKEARDHNNDQIFNYELYQNIPIECQSTSARFPTFAYDHVNLSGRAGYGVSDSCTIDTFSALRNDPSQLTRDRCRIQLFSRIFQGCPNLRPGIVDPDQEMPLVQGTSTTNNYEGVYYPAKRALTEYETKHPDPLLDCSMSVQDPKHIIEPWTWGGEPTRDFVRRQEFLSSCGKVASTRGNSRAQAVGLFQH